ncbi:MAG TPA: methyltransferase domain-containing protein [Terriglobales bacterium]|nr:methyltransferase domain-containing protein [Terriglobales bacterium]
MNDTDHNTARDREFTPLYARVLAPLIRPFPDFDLFFIKALRKAAVRSLQLQPGDRVLDVGCGPGGSFAYLVAAVAQSGEVTGVEISPELAMNARRRVEKNGWTNVQVIVGDAKAVKLQGSFDAVLMFGAPDIYASESVLANLVPHLKNGARVFAFGAKLSRNPLARVFNSAWRWIFSKLTFASTPKLDFEPWKALEACGVRLKVEEHLLGWMFFASGSLKRQPE